MLAMQCEGKPPLALENCKVAGVWKARMMPPFLNEQIVCVKIAALSCPPLHPLTSNWTPPC